MTRGRGLRRSRAWCWEGREATGHGWTMATVQSSCLVHCPRSPARPRWSAPSPRRAGLTPRLCQGPSFPTDPVAGPGRGSLSSGPGPGPEQAVRTTENRGTDLPRISGWRDLGGHLAHPPGQRTPSLRHSLPQRGAHRLTRRLCPVPEHVPRAHAAARGPFVPQPHSQLDRPPSNHGNSSRRSPALGQPPCQNGSGVRL